MALAVNDLTEAGEGYQLRHPRHTAVFTVGGLTFTPRRGGPEWRWQLVVVNAGEAAADLAVHTGPMQPVNDQRGVVSYLRGGLVERYVAQADSLEQQFIIPEPLALAGADLVITGRVQSAGVFEAQPNGWRTNDFRISAMGPDGDTTYGGGRIRNLRPAA